MSRPHRPWLGLETGQAELWVHPLKVGRGFRLGFSTPSYGTAIPGDQIARTVHLRPEVTTITYSHAAFQVRQHILTPRDTATHGILVLLEFIPIAIAAGTVPRDTVFARYGRLIAGAEMLYRDTRAWADSVLASTASVETPDPSLDLALEWAKINLEEQRVCNPDLGCGFVAGWGLSGDGGRPGFGWFFGGDAMINTYAMDALGPSPATRPAYSDLITGASGAIWLRPFVGVGEGGGPTAWLVLDTGGAWLGSVEVPAEFRIWEIGMDEILGTWVDEVGVQHPQVLRLTR